MVAATQRLCRRETDCCQRAEPYQSLECEPTSKQPTHRYAQHRYAEQRENGECAAEHDPGTGVHNLRPQGVEGSKVRQALKHHDVAAEERGETQLR